ncbi:hypothetical protein NDU88_007394 [Pleurodeles waltl]|uniref:Uncharacterized protein n=1 Tax=Pleurodeles waltl TaxID=8319 RepID=A0AAV7QKH6_PLEWA|nr:hypothetical protein NDU88_007394 [Pleurodeles waltl]
MLLGEDGSEIREDDLIAAGFKDFYTELYSAQSLPRGEVEGYLQTGNLTWLTQAQAEEIDKPFHIKEVIAAIACLKAHKFAGPDGFPAGLL